MSTSSNLIWLAYFLNLGEVLSFSEKALFGRRFRWHKRNKLFFWFETHFLAGFSLVKSNRLIVRHSLASFSS